MTLHVRMPWVQNPEHVVSQALGRVRVRVVVVVVVVVVAVFPRCAAGFSF